MNRSLQARTIHFEEKNNRIKVLLEVAVVYMMFRWGGIRLVTSVLQVNNLIEMEIESFNGVNTVIYRSKKKWVAGSVPSDTPI